MKFFANTYRVVFGILFLYLFINIPIYIQTNTYKLPIIRMQLIELIAWVSALGYLSLFLFAKKIHVWLEPNLVKTYFVWLAYSLLSIVLLVRFSYQIPYYFYLIFTLLPYYFLFVMQLIGFTELNREKTMTFLNQTILWLGKAYIPVFAFACLQYIFKSDFVNLNTEEKTLQATSELLGSFRPRSIFNSSYEFGLYSLLVFCLFIPLIDIKELKKNKVVLWITVLSAIGIVLSFTRNVYLLWGMVLIVLYVFKEWQNAIFLKRILPHIFTILSFALLLILSFQALSGVMLTDFLSSESTFVRFSLLYALMEGLVLNGSIIDILFGWGLIQHAGDSNLISIFPDIYNSEDGTLGVDNLFFAVFLNQGLIGLGIYLVLFQKMWNKLCSYYYASKNALILSSILLLGSFLGAGVFNLVHYGIYGYFVWFFAFAALSLFPRKKESSS